MSEPSTPLSNVGEYLIAAILAVVAWLMKTFTGRHLEAMDKMATRMDSIASDVSQMKSDINVLAEHQVHTDKRLDRLEDK